MTVPVDGSIHMSDTNGNGRNMTPKPALYKAEQIALYYEQLIRRGRIAYGDQLPILHATAQTWQVSYATAQKAYRILRDAGLTESRAGNTVGGTFVIYPATPE
jgi:DNA-binding transcriptional regulator YhcF (GntR family)